MNYKLLPSAALLLIAFVAIFWTACNKPTPFGADLLDDQVADYAFTNNIEVRCTVEREDSVITSSAADYYLCGELNDPIFGKSTAELFTHLRLDNLDPGFDKTKMAVDSVVMYLQYSNTGVYGDTLQPQTLRVLQVDNGKEIRYDRNYYSNNELPASTEIGRVDNFLPRPRTSESLISTTTKAPYLRVRLNDSFGRELLEMDSAITASDTLFWKTLRGLKIVTATQGASPGAMLAFNLNNPAFSRVRLYYSVDRDTGIAHQVFDYFFVGARKFVHYTHDYAGTPAGAKIDQVSDDLLYVQGIQGLRLKLEFPSADTFNNLIVNRAELEFTVASLPGDLPSLLPADQLILTKLQGDTLQVFTNDILYSIGTTRDEGFSRFGGYLEEIFVNDLKINRYRLSISDVFQQMVDDDGALDLKNRTLYLSVYPQNRSARRSVLYGPGSTTYPAKLNLKYTRLP